MNVIAGGIVLTFDLRRLRLGKLLKSGGAGSVYPVVDVPDTVAKVYHEGPDRAGYERKVAAMLELSPNLPDLVDAGRRYVQIAWPQALLRDERGRFAGFTMPLIDVQATSELECILQERQARAEGLPTGLGAKITLAANLAAVIAELHRQGHCVIDLKPVNVRFYRQTLYMAMLDCDGFSIQGHGERFAAQQITPDYLAPEFQNQPIAQALEEQQDRFALAVVIFQLLNFGIHPFTGRPQNDGVPTDIPGRIARRCYAYGLRGHPALFPSPVSGHASMPAELRALFDRAFATADAARPSAAEWASSLRVYAQRASQCLVQCAKDREHQHYLGLPCAACARQALIAETRRLAVATPRAPLRPVMASAAVAPAASRRTHPGGHRLIAPPLPVSLPGRPSLARRVAAPNAATFIPYRSQRLSRIIAGTFFGLVLVILFVIAIVPGSPRSVDRGQANVQAANLDEKDSPPSLMPMPPEPDVAQDPDVVRAKIHSVMQAMLSGNEYTLFNAYRVAAPARDDEHDALHDEFVRYAWSTPPRDAAKHRALSTNLEREHMKDGRNSLAAFELGWLAIEEGDRARAELWFVRAIGDNSERVEAWYGLGVLADNDDDTIAAIGIAALLRPPLDDVRVVRAMFPPDFLLLAHVDAQRFAQLQARALVAAQRVGGGALSSDVEALAQRPLPPR